MAEFPYPPKFTNFILSAFGESGRAWLAGLPTLLEALCRHWNLTLGEPFLLSINYAAPAVRADGSHAVLKVGHPHPELLTEIAALQAWAAGAVEDHGIVRLIDALPESGAMLLERIEPGDMLADLYGTPEKDEEAMRIAARVMRRIWRPLNSAAPFPTLERWTRSLSQAQKAFGGGSGPFPPAMIDHAQGLLRELLASQGEMVLLHGDFQHYNILRSGPDSWRVIDPKGVAGEREFEIGPLFYNPFFVEDWPNLPRALDRRQAVLAEELGFDRQRIAAWAFVEEVLSGIWSMEDHDIAPGETINLRIAEELEKLL